MNERCLIEMSSVKTVTISINLCGKSLGVLRWDFGSEVWKFSVFGKRPILILTFKHFSREFVPNCRHCRLVQKIKQPHSEILPKKVAGLFLYKVLILLNFTVNFISLWRWVEAINISISDVNKTWYVNFRN